MNWRRISELTLFDLCYSVFRLKGLLFLFPFCIFWYLVHKAFYDVIVTRFPLNEMLASLSIVFDIEIITNLINEHPISLSAYFILALYTTPFFALLAANNMFASDLGDGYFRYLVTRTQRIEIFLARYLSSFVLMAVPLIITGLIAAVISVLTEGYVIKEVLLYFIQIILILFIYTAPHLAYMAIISASVNSAIAALLLGMVSYVSIVVCIFIANAFYPESKLFSYLLPSGSKHGLFELDLFELSISLTSLVAYTIVFACIAWTILRRRNF